MNGDNPLYVTINSATKEVTQSASQTWDISYSISIPLQYSCRLRGDLELFDAYTRE
ncbi:hypothetical protein SIO70_24095 [Chitinophaga sancti]|uniref:hypothetical protein n=1 Tax=Chitinophaga sancti TaxID=1004 RepID=UPI002A758147|nr:hypothetical protein [Chitinophaga sancti]WPQ61446.1 hypothetical protein SIO70_24095 [Chitinophaga sancti]